MSTTTQTQAELDIRAHIVQIDRAIAETGKLISERAKLDAEAQKLTRERLMAPFLAGAAVCGAAATFGALLVRMLWGAGP